MHLPSPGALSACWGQDPPALPAGHANPQAEEIPYHRFRFGAVDAWVAPLHWLKRQVTDRTPVPAEDIHVIPLGLDDAWFEPLPTGDQHRRQCRLELGLSQNPS